MKKVNYLILLLLGISSFLWAQQVEDSGVTRRPKIGAQNWYSEMNNNPDFQEGCIYSNSSSDGTEDGEIKVKASVRFYLEEGDNLSNYPKMYLSYNFKIGINQLLVGSGIIGPFQDSDVTYGDEVEVIEIDANGTSVSTFFQTCFVERILTMDVRSFTGDFNYTYRLLTPTSEGEYINYPICDYTGSGELFDGCIFKETYYTSDCFDGSYYLEEESEHLDPYSVDVPWTCANTSPPLATSGLGGNTNVPSSSNSIWYGTKDICSDDNPFPSGGISGGLNLSTPINTSHTAFLVEAKRPTQDSGIGNEYKTVVTPNPFNENMLIKREDSFNKEAYSISVFDVSGKRVWNKDYQNDDNTSSNVKINTSDWPAGVYFIQLATSSSIETKQMVKVNN